MCTNSAINCSYKVLSNEAYWKIDKWFVTRCSLNIDVVDKEQAERFLIHISDKWQWITEKEL